MHNVIGYIKDDDETVFCRGCPPMSVVKVILDDREFDEPQHCTECESLLPHGLTKEGIDYVRESILDYQNSAVTPSAKPEVDGKRLKAWAWQWHEEIGPVWVAMGGSHGCLPESWIAVESKEAAIESLEGSHDLSENQTEELRETGSCDMDAFEHDLEHVEICKHYVNEFSF